MSALQNSGFWESLDILWEKVRDIPCFSPGYGVVDAVAESKPLLELARAKSVPIFYTKAGG